MILLPLVFDVTEMGVQWSYITAFLETNINILRALGIPFDCLIVVITMSHRSVMSVWCGAALAQNDVAIVSDIPISC